jgi:hypothetical protein
MLLENCTTPATDDGPDDGDDNGKWAAAQCKT